MAFVLKKSLLEKNATATKTFTHEETGLQVTLRPIDNPDFKKAASVIGYKQVESDAPLKQALSKENIHKDMLTFDEAWAFAFGEHIITDWNVEDEAGEPVPVGGDNFIAVIASLSNVNLLEWCSVKSRELSQELKEQAKEIKKKPSKDGDGSKTTKA